MNIGRTPPFNTDSCLQQLFVKFSHISCFVRWSWSYWSSFCNEHDDTWQTSVKSVTGNFSNILFLHANENNIHLCCEQYFKLAKNFLAVHVEMGEPTAKTFGLLIAFPSPLWARNSMRILKSVSTACQSLH